MFSTLDPVTRRLPLSNGTHILLTDTVGFVQKLPTDLIAAFRATLEEANDADFILHILDVTHPQRMEQAISVIDILHDIGLSEKPILTILNKWDKFPEGYEPYDDDDLRRFMEMFDSVVFSAGINGAGKMEILRSIENIVGSLDVELVN